MAADRQYIDKEIEKAVIDGDIPRLQRLAQYAVDNDDEGTARDIHGKLIKPHKKKWNRAS